MIAFTLHRNNSASKTVSRGVLSRDDEPAGWSSYSPALCAISDGFFWIGVRASGDAGLTDIQDLRLTVNGQQIILHPPSRTEHFGYAFIADPGDVVLTSRYSGLKPLTVHAHVHALPKRLYQTLSRSHADQTTTVIGDTIGALITATAIPSELFAGLEKSVRLDALLGCAAFARRLGMTAEEIALLNSARAVEASRHIEVALSKAHARLNDHARAKAIVASLEHTDAEFLQDKHAEYLAELKAHGEVGAELWQLEAKHKAYSPTGKIAYCLQNARPYREGGYAIRSHALAQAVHDAGRDIEAFVRPGFPSDIGTNAPTIRSSETIDDISYHFENGFGRHGHGYLYIADAADYFVERFRQSGIGLVHAATGYWVALPAAIAAHRLGLPFLYEVRGFWTTTREALEPGFSRTPQAERDRALEAITLALADHVITLNAAMKDHLAEYGVDAARISLIPNCVDSAAFAPRPRNPELARQHGINAGDTVIGYLGAMLEYEGLDILVEAVAPLVETDTSLKILIIGADPGKRITPGTVEFQLDALIAARGVSHAVSLIDRVPADQTALYYALFDICAYPRKSHLVCELVSPLKPLEAMANAKPIIVSNVAAMCDLVVDDKTGLVCQKDDVESLRMEIRKLTLNQPLRQRLGASGREFVANTRSWTKAAADVSAIYDNIAEPQNYRDPKALRRDLEKLLPKLFELRKNL